MMQTMAATMFVVSQYDNLEDKFVPRAVVESAAAAQEYIAANTGCLIGGDFEVHEVERA